jgi:cytidylate kinase
LKKILIAIDGHSSCGKSTLAKALGKALGYTYISSGDMYRAVTLYLHRQGVDIRDEAAVAAALPDISLRFSIVHNENHIFLNDEDVSEEIRRMYVAEKVSPVAALPTVRREMVRQQQRMGKEKGIVMDGRDIGTVVFPHAELKIFLTADVETRAQRRYAELLAKGHPVALSEIRHNLTARDHIDATRADSPLRKAEDAVLLDNSRLSPENQLQIALELVEARQSQHAPASSDA